MGIHEDARQGTLVGNTLTRYLLNNPNILNEQDPATGCAPLATAAVAGFADVVEQLLRNGAKADALSRDGETALLLTTRETSRNRPRIVQLLLRKIPADSVDATTAADDNNTPLMHAILRGGRRAGASLAAINNNGLTAERMAAADEAVALSLDPEKERSVLAKLADVVDSFLLYIVAWVNKMADGIMDRLFGLNPKLNEDIDEKVNDGGTPNKVEFLENIDNFVKNSPLERFFKGNPNFIQDLAKKATELKNDPTMPLGQPNLLPKVIKVTLHQQVIYCDNSSSMKRDCRWDAQVQLVKRITRILPEGDGIALRFINQDSPGDWEHYGKHVLAAQWRHRDWHLLKSKFLEPLVYSKLQPQTLARPLLISVITDGMPSREKDNAFVEAIKEWGVKLEQAGYPRESVKFMIGRIGTGKAAATFLKGVGNNKDIEDMVFVTSDQLDERFSAFREKEGDLDRWLIEMLFKPIIN
ncbi:hypothetical protein F5887DRAFT_919578 [Amanita rubescens]|nr:hypothetical protein F5887DRAFT_919578 [Amanita rubescens]